MITIAKNMFLAKKLAAITFFFIKTREWLPVINAPLSLIYDCYHGNSHK